jgi:hypothetical protein
VGEYGKEFAGATDLADLIYRNSDDNASITCIGCIDANCISDELFG